MLDDDDRRQLDEIERNLRRDDPTLEHVLTPGRGEQQPPWVPHVRTATAGALLFLAGMLGLGQLAALGGLVLITMAALEWTGERPPAVTPVRRRDADDRT